MKRLAYRTLILSLLFAVLVGAAVVYGRMPGDVNPLRAYGFDLCGEMACFMGLTPKHSDWQQAEKALGIDKFQGDTTGGNGERWIVRDTAVIELWSPLGETVVFNYRVHDNPGKLSTIGDYVALYGPPCGILPTYAPNGIQDVHVLIRGMSVGVNVANGFNARSPVFEVTLTAYSNCADGWKPWQGFVSIARYERVWDRGQP